MFNPKNSNQSYLIINPFKEENTILENQFAYERLLSVLYSHDYTVKNLLEVSEKNHTKGFFALIESSDNDTLRKEVLTILEFMNIDSAFLKYANQKNPVMIKKSGEEVPHIMKLNENSENHKNFIVDGFCFYFKSEIRYHYPKNKSHLKNGMIVEYLNDKTWTQREIKDVETEFDRMYNLLIKYNKLRVPIY